MMPEDILHFAHANWVEFIGYVGAMFTVAAYYMKRISWLRLLAAASNIAFIAYGYLAESYPQLILNCILLPLNLSRIFEIFRKMRSAKKAMEGEFSVDWLIPFMSRRRVKKGDVIFRRGDPAQEMYYTQSGTYRLQEIEKRVGPGEMLGEIGFFAADGDRTQTLECLEDGELMVLRYPQIVELYYQNPEFGLYLMRLTARRLMRDVERLKNPGQTADGPAGYSEGRT